MPRRTVALAMTIGGRVEGPPSTDGSPDPGAGRLYQWPGTYFRAAFRGKEVYFRTGKGRQQLKVSIDEQPGISVVSSRAGVYLVSGLTAGTHTVRLEVMSESQAGPNEFDGFRVPRRDALTAPTPLPRQMEFIGDSYTVGYGNTSATRGCSQEQIWATTDDAQAFGPLLGRQYGADYQVNAISGRGVVRNYNGFTADTLPQAYPFVLFDKKDRFADAGWQPQVIVVGLGTNDFSTALNAGERWKSRADLHADYEATLLKFLAEVRQAHPRAYLILWATDGAQGETQAEAKAVVDRMRSAGETRVDFVPIHGLEMSGCDSHPSAEDDKTIAARLRSVIDGHPDLWQSGLASGTTSSSSR